MRSAPNCRYPVKLIFPSDGFIARLGLIAKLVQQFLQKLTPPLDNPQDQVITVGISRRQMPSVHQARDITFSPATCFQQRLFGGAFVDVFSDELPPLFWWCPTGPPENLGTLISVLKSSDTVECSRWALRTVISVPRPSCARPIACWWMTFCRR